MKSGTVTIPHWVRTGLALIEHRYCRDCKSAKPNEEFPPKNLYRCRLCSRVWCRKYYWKNTDKMLGRRKTEAGRAYMRKVAKEQAVRHPLKYKARYRLRNAIARGEIIPQPCRDCGNPIVHGHHPDYRNALDVVWLCLHCHVAEHHRLKDLENEA